MDGATSWTIRFFHYTPGLPAADGPVAGDSPTGLGWPSSHAWNEFLLLQLNTFQGSTSESRILLRWSGGLLLVAYSPGGEAGERLLDPPLGPGGFRFRLVRPSVLRQPVPLIAVLA